MRRMVFFQLGYAEGSVTFCAGDFSAGVPLGNADFLAAVWTVKRDESGFGLVGGRRRPWFGDSEGLVTFRALGAFAGVCFGNTEVVSAMAAPKINHFLSRFLSDVSCGRQPGSVISNGPLIYTFIVSGGADGSKCFPMHFLVVFAVSGEGTQQDSALSVSAIRVVVG